MFHHQHGTVWSSFMNMLGHLDQVSSSITLARYIHFQSWGRWGILFTPSPAAMSFAACCLMVQFHDRLFTHLSLQSMPLKVQLTTRSPRSPDSCSTNHCWDEFFAIELSSVTNFWALYFAAKSHWSRRASSSTCAPFQEFIAWTWKKDHELNTLLELG